MTFDVLPSIVDINLILLLVTDLQIVTVGPLACVSAVEGHVSTG